MFVDRIKSPRCPKCGAMMSLRILEPERPGFDSRTSGGMPGQGLGSSRIVLPGCGTSAEISQPALGAYGEVLDGENLKLIREVASWRDPVTSNVKFNKDTGLPEKVPLGQALLLETQAQWYGTFELDDPETMDIFERYVGTK